MDNLTDACIAELKRRVDAISEELKGPMSNLDRALLVADRKDIRAKIAELIEAKGC